MWAVFKPWRRRIGFCTLMMACVLMSIWIRSLKLRDSIELFTSFSCYRLSSENQRLGFKSYDHGRVIPRQHRWNPEWNSIPKDQIANVDYPTIQRQKFTWKYLGFYVWRQHDPELTEFLIDYRTIMSLLTLLSACLLLSKPRKEMGTQCARTSRRNVANGSFVQG